MPPTNNWEKLPQTQEEFEAARVADRFFSDVKGKAAGIRELAEAHCFSAVVDAAKLLNGVISDELRRRADARHRQPVSRGWKVVVMDNYDREMRDDALIQDGLSEEEARAKAKEWNDASPAWGPNYFSAQPQSYRLREFGP